MQSLLRQRVYQPKTAGMQHQAMVTDASWGVQRIPKYGVTNGLHMYP
jgi:hypothetical protein